MGNDIVLAFDAYGTLFSTSSIADKLSQHFGDEKADTISAAWRKYQLEYTWRANSMGLYFDFFLLTRRALRHALAESSVSLNETETKEMMTAYDSLTLFSDVQPTLAKLRALESKVKLLIHSNGTHDMVSSLLKNAAPEYTDMFKIVTVEQIRRYKPAAEAYQFLAKSVGKDALNDQQMGQIWHVSGNPFDVAGAKAVGMNSIWIDRPGTGWVDNLVPAERGKPSETVRSLDQVVDIITRVVGGEHA